MAAIEMWLQQPAAQAVGWALLQFVWQGTVVGLLTAAALLALRRSASDVRYLVSAIGLALMLTLAIVTGVQKYQALQAAEATRGGVSGVEESGVSEISRLKPDVSSRLKPGAPRGSRSGGSAFSESGADATTTAGSLFAALRDVRAEALMPSLMVIWLAGVSLLTLRLLTGWLWVQRLRTRGVAAADESLRRMAARLSRRLRIRRAVTLLESSLVDVPTVIGFLKPVVLLPATALGGLTLQQVEAILAHELAHIRRHDYLVNLLQTLVETVLFYHPAVWWVSRRIRIERENCCDDLAVSLCGDPVTYATALAELEAMRSSGPVPERHIAMAATGGSLLQRVRRLLGAPTSHSGRGPAWLAGGVALLLVGGITLGATESQRPLQPVVAAAHDINLDAVPAPAPAQPPAPWRAAAAIAASPAPQPPAAPSAAPAAPDAAPAAPPAPPAVAQQTSISQHVDNANGNWVWSNNGERLEVSYQGTFEFTDDDTDVRQLSAGGWLKISDGKWLGRHSVEIRERGGQLEHLYYVNASARPYEPEGREWLHQNLPKFVRNTGIGAPQRVARLLKSGGPAAVTTEIGRVDGAYVKGIYFRELFKQASLTPEQYRQAMTQASREMRGSNYELAQLLIAVADKLPNDETSRAAYFDAASAINSDYEVRRVYSTMLKRGAVSPAVLGSILAKAKSIDSDYELSELLRQILSQQPLDERNRTAFFATLATMGSDYERHRVLSAVVSSQAPTDPAVLEAALGSAASIGSNYETSQFLQEVLRQNGVEGRVRAPFFAAANTIGSDYERGRVLQAVVRKPGASADTLRAVMQSAQRMGSDYERSQLLQLIARSYTLTGDLRDAYVAQADRLGDYEQTQALAALVRSERRK